jgi:hypothetical protein
MVCARDRFVVAGQVAAKLDRWWYDPALGHWVNREPAEVLRT